ncbi:hypothetical protein SCARD494_14291, partial [Seiridium cardinale]
HSTPFRRATTKTRPSLPGAEVQPATAPRASGLGAMRQPTWTASRPTWTASRPTWTAFPSFYTRLRTACVSAGDQLYIV